MVLFHEVRSSGFINIYNCENDIPLAWITFPLKRIPIDSFKFIDSLFHTWTGHIGLWQIYETSYIHWQHQWTLRKKMNDVQITDLEFISFSTMNVARKIYLFICFFCCLFGFIVNTHCVNIHRTMFEKYFL